MWFWLTAEAKPTANTEEIVKARQQWIAERKEQQLQGLCRRATRYVVVGKVPPTVHWLIEAEDDSASQFVTEHFSPLWTIETHAVVPQPLAEAVSPNEPTR